MVFVCIFVAAFSLFIFPEPGFISANTVEVLNTSNLDSSCWGYQIEDIFPIGSWENTDSLTDPKFGDRVWANPQNITQTVEGLVFLSRMGHPDQIPRVSVSFFLKKLSGDSERSFQLYLVNEDSTLIEAFTTSTTDLSSEWHRIEAQGTGRIVGVWFNSEGGTDRVVMDSISISICYADPVEVPTSTPMPTQTPRPTSTNTPAPTPSPTVTKELELLYMPSTRK